MSNFTKALIYSFLVFWVLPNFNTNAQVSSQNKNETVRKRVLTLSTTNDIQASEIEVIRVSERTANISGIGLSFDTQDKVASGTANFQWGFIHNADSLFIGHFAPSGNPNSEPYLVYIKCFYPGSVFADGAQSYDNFNPDFTGIGGVNFAAFIKNDYDEYRTWNGTAWSAGNTSLNPRFSNAPQNKNIEVAIPWSAIMPGGGIPDSVQVVCYRTNGNAGGIFSYAQMPAGLPAGGNASPGVNQKFTIKIKEKFTLTNPVRFGQKPVTNTNNLTVLVYNPGTNATTINGNLTSSADTVLKVTVQPANNILPKKYSPFVLSFLPKKGRIKYEATIAVPNNSANNPFQFKVNGTGKGTPDVSSSTSSGPVGSSISFGTNIIPNTPVNISVTVNSIGDDTVFFAPNISSNPTQFEVVSVANPVLAPGVSTTMILRFVGAATGNYAGKVYMIGRDEGPIEYNLSATVGGGTTTPKIEVVNIPRRFITIDGNVNTGWQALEAQNSASAGIQWYVAHSPDSLYIGRKGGNNAEPQIIYINGVYPGSVKTNTAQAYDGVSGNLAGQGGLNFVAYLKTTYDEFRNWNGTAWTAGITTLTPKYGTAGTDASMEIAIPWSAITNGKGIPDSIKLAFLQTNGNVGSPFVYGAFPASNPIGALTTPVFGQLLNKEIARKVTLGQEFYFGSVVTGASKDTTLLVYNASDANLISFLGVTFQIGNAQLQVIQQPSSTINARSYSPFKFRFTPDQVGPFTGEGSANYTFSGPVSALFKITADVLPEPQAIIQVKIGNSVYNNADTLRFGNLVIGSLKDSTIRIKNIGNDTLRISTTPISGSGFSIIQSLGLKIAPGDSSIIKVRFAASTPIGNKTGNLTVFSNVGGVAGFRINLKGVSQNTPFVASTLEIRHIANNLIYTSGNIPASQLQPKLLLSDNAGIKWYASWDTAHLYIVKLGGNRAEPQIIYARASYQGAVFTDQPTIYDGFHPSFTGIGGINFSAYFKETATPYDESRNWNGTLWLPPNLGLQPQYGNQAGQDIFAVRIPWGDITQGNGVPDSVKLVMYQTNATPGNFFAYGQSPVGLPSGNAVTPPVNLAHSKKIITRLPKNAEFDFGNVPVGKSIDTTFLLQNEGAAGSNVVVNGPSTITGSAFSASSQTGTGTNIPSKKWGFVKVRFSPNALGNVTGSLTANATFTNPTAPYTINFKGKGVPTPVAGILLKIGSTVITNGSTSNLGLGEIGTQLDTTVRIINTGDDSLRISGLGSILPGWSIVGFPAGKVRGGDSTSFRIRKTTVSVGNNAGQFSLATNVANLALFGFSINVAGDSALAWTPSFPTINDSITITYNAAFGTTGLRDTNTIYIHSGVVTTNPIGTNWVNVQGNFNQPADSVKMTNIGQNQHRIKFKIREFYNLVGNPAVYRLGMLFRNGNGSKSGKTRTNEDFYIQTNSIPSASQIRIRTASGTNLANNATVSFGTRTIGTLKDTSIYIKNTGSTALIFTSITVTGAAFSQVGTSPFAVAVGDSILIVIRLNVTTAGIITGALNLQSNAGNFPFAKINFSANGIVSNVSKIENENAWRIFPNPSSDLLHIQNTSIFKEVKWNIFDLNGKSIQAGENKLPLSLQLDGLPKGMYFIKMESDSKIDFRKFSVK